MDILYMRCAGLDIHRDTIVACVRLAEAGGVTRLVETFATTTSELERLSEWLAGHGVTCIAMEATGVYWKPVWAVLAGDFGLVLANAHHVKAVPGRKTDVNDATWLADLLAHGLIQSSFVPAMPEQALRDLTRARQQLTREKASHVQRINKTLQAATIKLGSVLSNIMGQSGRILLEALAAGERDPERLAGLVRTKIRASHAQVVEAVRGRLAAHQRLLLQVYLAQVDALDAAIAAIDHELGERLEPVQETVQRLTTMPGLSPLSAAVVISEIGIDMSRFPTAGHLISWAGLCPRNDESAGKRRSTRLRKGAPWLKTTLVQCAWAGTRKKGSYLQAQFQRLRHRRGPKKAVCAVAASILTAAYHMLRDGTFYQDLGPDHLRRATPEAQASRLARQITKLGFTCTLAPADKPVSV